MEKKHFNAYKNKTIMICLISVFVVSLPLLALREYLGFRKLSRYKFNYVKLPFVTDAKLNKVDHVRNTFEKMAVDRDRDLNIIYNEKSGVTISRDKNKTDDTKLREFVNDVAIPVSCMLTGSKISCVGGTLEEVIVNINKTVSTENANADQYYTLVLSYTIFPSNSLHNGWLENISVSIDKLTIKESQLSDLGDSVFSGPPFPSISSLLYLSLINTNLKQLMKSSFRGSRLASLEVSFSGITQGLTIEEDLLGYTASSVQSLSFTYCITSGEAVSNLTGKGSVLSELLSLELSINSISYLEAGAFSKAPKLLQLYLTSSGLTWIDVNAFQGLYLLQTLTLKSNNLEKLQEDTFKDLHSLRSLYVEGNPWNCTCDMQWFKAIFTRFGHDYLQCKVGYEFKSMSDVDFCPDDVQPSEATSSAPKTSASTATNDSSALTTTEQSTEPSAYIFEKILCRNLLMYPFEDSGSSNIREAVLVTSYFKRRNVNFTVLEWIGSTSYRLELIGDIKSTDFIIWTNVKDRMDYGCIYQIAGVIIMNLQFGKTYTLCFASNDTTDHQAIISDDCTAFTTPLDWGNRAWLHNNQKTTVLVSIIVTFLVTLSLASLAVYYLVKYNPELIKGNKRVLIVKRGSYSPKVLVMPISKDNVRRISLRTNHEGYLTPKFKRKSKYSDLRYEELETISDSAISDLSCEMAHNESLEDNIGDIYEQPPPLPPNHPKRRDSGKPYFYSNM